MADAAKKNYFRLKYNPSFSLYEENSEGDLVNFIKRKKEDINIDLFKKHFTFQNPSNMLKKLTKTRSKKYNRQILNLIKSGLKDLKNEIEKMSEDEKEIENPNEVDIVTKILDFNEQSKGKGLKILTPQQMLSRLPISLAQLKVGNNSEKLKNEIRQLLYSLYRSRKIS